MRKTFTLLFTLFSILAICQPQIAKEVTYYKTMQAPDPNTRIVIRCAPTKYLASEYPLMVIDGLVHENKDINKIDPGDIESVTILKQHEASGLFGRRGANGVILMTTKSARLRKFIIKDFLDGKPIPSASVKFELLNKSDSLLLVANDSGVVVTDKLKAGADYNIEVSSIGFNNTRLQYKISTANKESIILMDRNINLLSEVAVTAFVRTIHCKLLGEVIRIYATALDSLKQTSSGLYPNPILRGNNFYVKLPTTISPISSSYIIRIFSLSGTLIHQQRVDGTKLKTINVASDNRWTAGTYIVQVVNDAGKQCGQHKLIIQ